MFFENVGAEATANPKMMIVHEVMGRDCGWLTAATAAKYRERLAERPLLPMIGLTAERLDVHAVYVPEMAIDLEKEASAAGFGRRAAPRAAAAAYAALTRPKRPGTTPRRPNG